jgi:hypothetical protein
MSSPVVALYGNFLEILMQQPNTVRDIRALIDNLDKQIVGLHALIEEGRRVRAELVKHLAAVAWEEGGNPDIVRIVRNDP